MINWESNGEPKEETWGAFVAFARSLGASLESLPEVPFPDGTVGPVAFLRREVDGTVLTYPLPKGCTPERKLGFGRVAHVCARLELPWPKWIIRF